MALSIPESVIEDVKMRTDLVDLIASYGIQIRSSGSSKTACCPFHNEKTPSFHINERKGFYHCFGCGESGDAIKFVEKMDGLSFVEAVKKLAAPLGIKVEEKEDPEASRRKRLYSLMGEVAAFYRRCLVQTKEGAKAREYLVSRELDDKTCDDWQIGYAPAGAAVMLKWAEKHGYTPEELEEAGIIKAPQGPGDKGYHRFGGRLMFTIKDRQGRTVAFSGRQLVPDKKSGKYVNSPETPIFRKSSVLFAFDRAAAAIARSPNREGIVCEGQIDTIRLHMAGFTNAVASQGTAFTEEHAAMLKKAADSMVVMYDDDAAGHKATVKVARLFLALEMPVRTVTLPGGEDPDSFLRKNGAGALKKLVEGAESIVAFQMRAESAKEVNPKSIDAVARISRSVLQTIACAKSAVLRASMLDEAARLMWLPVAAMQEELAKLAVERPKRTARVEENEPQGEEGDRTPGEETQEKTIALRTLVIPPPPAEMALMGFLMEHEYDAQLSAIAGEFLPPGVFAHDFTRRFVDVWRDECASGEDRLAAFGEMLSDDERGWFDSILLSQGKTQASGLSPADIARDFVRTLWKARLARLRGDLSADGSEDMKRMKLTMDMKRLATIRWELVKDLVSEYI